MATLASHTGTDTHAQDAQRRLVKALQELDPAAHTRGRALAAARLAMLQLIAEDLERGAHSARDALQSATRVRSARLMHSLATLRTIASRHPDQPTMQTLASEITTAIGADDRTGRDASGQAGTA
jgi:nicotinic acid mononucleotide adenylyltransferase